MARADALAQLRYLGRDAVTGRGSALEVVAALFTPQFLAVASYRIQRAAYLLIASDGTWCARCSVPCGRGSGPRGTAGARVLAGGV